MDHHTTTRRAPHSHFQTAGSEMPSRAIGPQRRTSPCQRQSPYSSQHQYRTTRGTFFEVAFASCPSENDHTSVYPSSDALPASPRSIISRRTVTPDLIRQRSISSSPSVYGSRPQSPVVWSVEIEQSSTSSREYGTNWIMPNHTEDRVSVLGKLITMDSYAGSDGGANNEYWMCYTCHDQLPPEDFKDKQSFKKRLDDNPDSPLVYLRRFCIPCGIKLGAHKPGPVFETKRAEKKRWICPCLRVHDAKIKACPRCSGHSIPTERAGEFIFEVSFSSKS